MILISAIFSSTQVSAEAPAVLYCAPSASATQCLKARFKRNYGPPVWPDSGALLDTLAFVAFNLGIGSAYTSIVTALASLFSAVTVLLAWAILRERLAPAQWAGVAVILAGVLLVSL